MSKGTRVALGPVMPGWGSWEWVGSDMMLELSRYCSTQSFTYDEVPDASVIVIIKHPPPQAWWQRVSRHSKVIFAPIDFYDSSAAIDADGRWLSQVHHIVVHCHRLRPYFSPYASTSFLDHHVKYVAASPAPIVPTGPILWVGVHTNLSPLVEWVNQHGIPAPLLALSNFEKDALNPLEMGFRSDVQVSFEVWNPERHLHAIFQARAALDIKGADFRSRHKPPTKALDFLAAGLPLAMNAGSSSAEHLADMGFALARPEDPGVWLSSEYAQDCQRLGGALRELLSRERVGFRWWHLLQNQ